MLISHAKTMAAALLILFGVMAWTSVREKSTTFDEIAHLTAGYSYWTTGDYRLNPENGILPQRWVALPLLAMHLEPPHTDDAHWWGSDVWGLGRQFFYESGNDLDAMLWWSRGMVVLLAVVLGAVVFVWSRRLFGPAGALISLVLYVFSPTILAHSRLVTSDLTTSFTFVASLGCFWLVLHRVSVATVLVSAVVMGCLFVSKMSAVLFLPVAVILVGIRLAVCRPLILTLGKKQIITDRNRQLAVLLGVLAFQAVAVILIIWAFYGFHYNTFRESQPDRDQMYAGMTINEMTEGSLLGIFVRLARDVHLLPEPYLHGFAFAVRMSQARASFLNGQYSSVGWRLFFPYAFLVKTPLPVLAMLCVAAVAAFARWRAVRIATVAEADRWHRAQRGLYRAAPLWVFLLVYWFVAIRTNLNIGHRHILPTYPVMFILCGAAGYWFTRRARIMAGLVVLLLAALAVESVATWPNYLAYFNQLAGGPDQGYRHLIDSSLDWGQDLPGLAHWLAERQDPAMKDKPVYQSYFGTGIPDYYGIEARQLPGYMGWRQQKVFPLGPGTYCMSATMLQSVYIGPRGPWNVMYEVRYDRLKKQFADLGKLSPEERESLERQLNEASGSRETMALQNNFAEFDQLRLGRLNAYLRTREPDDNVGHSILIYYLDEDDLDRALNQPIELESE